MKNKGRFKVDGDEPAVKFRLEALKDCGREIRPWDELHASRRRLWRKREREMRE